MVSHQMAFFLPFGLWILLGWILTARVFVTTLRAKTEGDPATRAATVQRQFVRVGLILLATLPVAFGAYYLLRG